ncbi:hypothetical protein ACSBR1_034078 [Camellia fascicularis]
MSNLPNSNHNQNKALLNGFTGYLRDVSPKLVFGSASGALKALIHGKEKDWFVFFGATHRKMIAVRYLPWMSVI